jgi:hypothetical protein
MQRAAEEVLCRSGLSIGINQLSEVLALIAPVRPSRYKSRSNERPLGQEADERDQRNQED